MVEVVLDGDSSSALIVDNSAYYQSNIMYCPDMRFSYISDIELSSHDEFKEIRYSGLERYGHRH